MSHLPRYHCALAGLAAGLMTLGSGTARADVVLDEFSHVDDYWGHPWPLEFYEHEVVDVFEQVIDGVIPGDNGRIRETDIYVPSMDTPGEDLLRMNVETTTGIFDYDSTAGADSFVQFGYGYRIVNTLHADFSAEHGLRIDFAELQIEPGPNEGLRIGALIIDGNYVPAESEYAYVLESGPQSVLLPFSTFNAAETLDLTDVAAVNIEIFATTGTDYSIERLIAAGAAPGDANADGAVDALDVLALFSQWGDCPGCLADFDDDGVVNVSDFLILLAHWVDAS
ncbi:MAG: hypothetical protein ACYTGF_10715 [Planctomycetota bacterium]|jgi:hypothetical protein